jgi:uncharacterized membrane-anchored protein YjiN (DUF445 family)
MDTKFSSKFERYEASLQSLLSTELSKLTKEHSGMKLDNELRLSNMEHEVAAVHSIVKDRMKAQVSQLVTETMKSLNFRVD